MKAKQKTTKAKKSQVTVRDIKPKRSATGGRKHKHAGGTQPLELHEIQDERRYHHGLSPGSVNCEDSKVASAAFVSRDP